MDVVSEGELRRLLEFVLEDELKWEPHEIEIIKSLQQNYGLAGYALSQYLADNVDKFPVMVGEAVAGMYTEFKGFKHYYDEIDNGKH